MKPVEVITPIGSVKELLKCFLSGRNKQTLEAYRTDLEDFAHFMSAIDIVGAATRFISSSAGEANGLVLQYRNNLTERGFQANTINRRLAAIRSLTKIARTLGIIFWSIEIPNLKAEPYRDTRGPGRAAVQEMLEKLRESDRPKNIRDYAILRLLYDLALRASELVGVDVADLNITEKRIAIMGKGKTQKIELTLPEVTSEAVSRWISIRDPEEIPLFYNFDRTGKRMRLTRAGLYQLICKLGLKIGVKTRPHGIRHSSISQAIKVAKVNGITLPEVKQFSRHASLQTLQIYADQEQDLFGRIATLVSQGAPGANNLEIGSGGTIEKIKKAKK